MKTGGLNKIIAIQQRTEATDSDGGTYFTWSAFATVWAKKRPLRGRELVAAHAAQSLTEVMFYIRYLSGMTSSMRIVHGGEYYDITAIVNIDEGNRELEISTKTGMSTG